MDISRDIKSVPVLRPFVAMIIGILARGFFSLPERLVLITASASLLFFGGILILRWALKPTHSWISGLAVFLFFMCAGFMVSSRFHYKIKPLADVSSRYWIGEVLTEPQFKNKLLRFDISIFSRDTVAAFCKSQVFLQLGKDSRIPQIGQYVVIKTVPERIKGPTNPGEFNYAGYLEKRGVLYRCFVKEGEWSVLCKKESRSLKITSIRFSRQLWSKIENLESGNENLGVLYAVALGSKSLLTPEIREAYAATGAMHVLAVSGLHVGLIWMVLGYIFIWVKKLPAGRFLQFIVISGLIWFYALMTGMSPSVVRSAGMFTLVSFGKIIQKESSVYNSLSISAFFGLLFSPQWLTDAGFQLSYTAVLSIVFFQPKVSSLFNPRIWLLRKIWDISSVSIAAQLGTLPLTLFYFNRFPPWFILSNLVVIPLVTLIMMVFIVLLISAFSPILFGLVLKVLLFVIAIMNSSLEFIERLPSPHMDSIYLSDFQMFCFVFFLLALSAFIRYRKNKFVFMGFTAVLLLFSSGTLQKYNSTRHKEMVLFSVPGKMMLGFFEGNSGRILHNAPDSIDITGSYNFSCKPYLIERRIHQPEISSLCDSSMHSAGLREIPGNFNYFCRFGNKTILILNNPDYFSGWNVDKPLVTDFVIANNRIPRLWKNQVPVFLTSQLLLSTANSRYTQVNLGDLYVVKPDYYYDARISGAFRYPLR